MGWPQFTCARCGSHDLIAKPITITDTRETPAVTVPGEWVLVCGNSHQYVGVRGEVIQITGQS